MPECDHCHLEKIILIHVQDASLIMANTSGPLTLEAKWCLPCLVKAYGDTN